uniref:Glycosyltransferase RgtA/B/C/D-like domain-containing protein n=1 Tax=candidate division WOR-3 bacterium TaxID=2052148 RepID=A0A7V0Z633_UNCW3
MQIKNEKFFKTLPRLLIIIGIILRLSQYIYNRSLTEGEAPLAMNIIERSYQGLLRPLDYVQAAPIGFLYIEKLFVNIFGNNEYALRIFPLIAGILGIYIFYEVLKHINDTTITIFGLGFFVLNDHLIYFSSEVKPYSSDLLFSLLLVLLTLITIRENLKIPILILTGIIGAISIWFSFPAVFVFSGIGIVLLIYTIKNKNYNALIALTIIGAIWILSFILNYFICIRHYTAHKELVDFWQKDFIPFPPVSLKALYQIVYMLIRIFKNPGGFSIYDILLALLFFITGIYYLYQNKRTISLIFILPLIITFICSMFKLYPFEGRVILFIAPILAIFVGAGISLFYKVIKKDSRIIAMVLSLILFLQPTGTGFYHLIKPRAPEELKPVLEYLKKNKKDEDIVYVYYGAINAFKYYKNKFFNPDESFVLGIESRKDWSGYYQDIEKLKGNKRVWFIFSHIATHLGGNEEKVFLSYLNLIGSKIELFTTSGASAYLYDLSK